MTQVHYPAVTTRDPDVVVIGSGPNGLVAACVLAKRGFRVLVLEANARRPGGALGSEEATRPGFIHDVGAAFFPFATRSPAFRELDLARHGLVWLHAPIDSCHPAHDGSVACVSRNLDLSEQHFGSPEDGRAFRKLATWHGKIEDRLLRATLLPIPTIKPLFELGPLHLLRALSLFTSSGARLSRRLFRTAAAQRVLPSLALHADVGPEDRFGAALGYMLGMLATTGGYPVPRGGAQSITNALVGLLEVHGGRLRLGARVEKIVVQGKRASAVRLAGGEEIPALRAIMADTAAPALFLDLLSDAAVPGRVVRKMKRFPFGWGTFKVDWALSGEVPWKSEPARRSAVVHTGDDLEDLARFTAQVRQGGLPDRPYLVIGQQSLVDPTRAPDGHHTLWAYTHAPSAINGGWDGSRDTLADVVEQRIEELAPGFRSRILARRVMTPADLESMDENLVGGDNGGGSNAWNHLLIWRPLFPYFRYRMPVRGVYLCSSYAHPGSGVHGMCGYNAAQIATRDLA